MRNLGGIIVVDFIDMEKASHRREVERRMRKAMSLDRARHRVGPISKFGLCTITRQRMELPLRLIGFQKCSCCEGTGLQRSSESAAARFLRALEGAIAAGNVSAIAATAGTEVANRLNNRFRRRLAELESSAGVVIRVDADGGLAADEFRVTVERFVETKQPVEEEPEPIRSAGNGEKGTEAAPSDVPHRKRRRRRRKKTKKTVREDD